MLAFDFQLPFKKGDWRSFIGLMFFYFIDWHFYSYCKFLTLHKLFVFLRWCEISGCMTARDGIYFIIAKVQANEIIIIIWKAKRPAATRCQRRLRRLLYPKKELKSEPLRNCLRLRKKKTFFFLNTSFR